jgi:hypothetical protein
MTDDSHYLALAAAYARGSLVRLDLEDTAALQAAQEAGLRLHRFKRTAGLPRVKRVIGALRGFTPARLLDVGSGRGAFLWPLLDQLPGVAVTAIDLLPHRVEGLARVRAGGVARLTCARMDASALGFAVGTLTAASSSTRARRTWRAPAFSLVTRTWPPCRSRRCGDATWWSRKSWTAPTRA